MKMKIIFPFWSLILAKAAVAGQLPPAAFPVFLKAGFSSILEFDETPIRVVLGDSQSFQVEKVDRSIVVRTLVPYAASNMFVYFRNDDPRLFVLTASEDANPTYYKKFEKEIKAKQVNQSAAVMPVVSKKLDKNTDSMITISKINFDPRKDYLTLDCELMTESKDRLKPSWDLIRLKYKDSIIKPFKLWAERKDVQKSSKVKFRLIFIKPNLSRDLSGVTLVVPLLGQSNALTISIKGGK
jgi:hypothetical protein